MTALAILFGISQVARRWGMPSDCLKTSAYRGEGRRWWKNHGKTMERWWWWRWCWWWWWWWWWCRIFLFRSVKSVELSRDAGKKTAFGGTFSVGNKDNEAHFYVTCWKTVMNQFFLPEIVSPPVWQHAAGREQRMRPALFRHSSGVQSGGGKAWVSQAETGGPRGATWIS